MTTENSTSKPRVAKRTGTARKPRTTSRARATGAAVRKRKQETGTIVCQDTLHISGVRDWHAELQKAVDNRGSMVLDGSRVERVDTASVQLLTALCLSLRAKGTAFTWKEPSAVLMDSARQLGLAESLGLEA
jgi:anti-anti-sigma regulatory factor